MTPLQHFAYQVEWIEKRAAYQARGISCEDYCHMRAVDDGIEILRPDTVAEADEQDTDDEPPADGTAKFAWATDSP
jgi:hypothetical protein